MSVIAFDGKTVAADRQATCSGCKTTSSKLFKLASGEIVGFTGSSDIGMAMLEWYKNGADCEKYPKYQTTDDWVRLVVITKKGVFFYETTPNPVHSLDKKCAFGCGRDFALGAMEMGANAIKAVEIASKFSTDCGMGIDSFKIR
jgi:ATP-dependent protease HslVU (ClpYQ) peptidase subunit